MRRNLEGSGKMTLSIGLQAKQSSESSSTVKSSGGTLSRPTYRIAFVLEKFMRVPQLIVMW
jgi:hypothetical protein